MDSGCQQLQWTDVSPQSARRARMFLGTCPDCGRVSWRDDTDPVDPAVAMERLFGSFELVDRMAGLRSPGEVVLAYRPPHRRAGQILAALERGRWTEGQPGLWMTTDGELLLLCPSDPLFLANLTQGA